MTVQIVAIVDKSGSMSAKRNDAIGGFNTFIEDQKKDGEDAEFTSYLFDTTYRLKDYRIPINEVQPLTLESYVPGGGTALLDAIGKSITQFEHIQKSFPDKAKGMIFVIITDGEERDSHEYTQEQIKELTTRCEKEYGWKFVYLGADQDAFSVAASMGISTAMAYADTGVGVRAAYAFMSDSTALYRASVRDTSKKVDSNGSN